ncbi:MAG: [FeFe] hydrogenase, group A [Subdoligranulum sp.]|nr:[FeFe] hydrogenase, group A [Subdoligranulum sp.]MCI7542399.1 [FeFe] hydrogenase, group A [Subdoligranulum sp.]MDY5922899.1 [FeFe] hydrogenase, group A [Oscillospiraceae bacterium]
MVSLTINGRRVQAPEGTTIMEAARLADIHIPHLCFLKGINEIAACRVCCVEVEGERAMVTACNTPVMEGMVVHTNSPRARQTRRVNVELILSQHDCRCATCVRSGNCQLQNIANDLGILQLPFETQLPKGLRGAWTTTFPLYRDYNKCIKCMRCIQICEKVQTLKVWDLAGTGGRTTIDVSGNMVIKDSDCSLCGQCVTHCPVGGLRERDDTAEVYRALADPELITVVQVAPAVRTAWGESLGIAPEKATMGLMTAALKALGFDYVFDTCFTADLTIMEEANELLQRLKAGDLADHPMFTSCCPGWVRFLKSQYPQLTRQLSTAKSPQQMFGSITKSWFAQKIGADAKNIRCISIMPCMAKKAECALPTMRTEAGPDVDIALTTREFVRMIRADKIDVALLEEAQPDAPLGIHTGAGEIFGASGGVMEAALRTAVFALTGHNPSADGFQDIRRGQGLREVSYSIGGVPLRCAVVSGLGEARKLIEAILAGKAHYDFVEVMACPGGCAGGGGQPISCEDQELAGERGKRLYQLDQASLLRFSHENPEVQALYRDYLGEPLSEKSEQLLHTDHTGWQMPAEVLRR